MIETEQLDYAEREEARRSDQRYRELANHVGVSMYPPDYHLDNLFPQAELPAAINATSKCFFVRRICGCMNSS